MKKKKKNRENFFEIFFFDFPNFFFRRNLTYDEYITHAIFFDHRSRGSGATRGNTQTQDEDLLYRFQNSGFKWPQIDHVSSKLNF